MGIRIEVLPFLGVAVVLAVLIALVGRLLGARARRAGWCGAAVGAVLAAYLLYFFRDPPRTPPADEAAIVAGADGKIANIVS